MVHIAQRTCVKARAADSVALSAVLSLSQSPHRGVLSCPVLGGSALRCSQPASWPRSRPHPPPAPLAPATARPRPLQSIKAKSSHHNGRSHRRSTVSAAAPPARSAASARRSEPLTTAIATLRRDFTAGDTAVDNKINGIVGAVTPILTQLGDGLRAAGEGLAQLKTGLETLAAATTDGFAQTTRRSRTVATSQEYGVISVLTLHPATIPGSTRRTAAITAVSAGHPGRRQHGDGRRASCRSRFVPAGGCTARRHAAPEPSRPARSAQVEMRPTAPRPAIRPARSAACCTSRARGAATPCALLDRDRRHEPNVPTGAGCRASSVRPRRASSNCRTTRSIFSADHQHPGGRRRTDLRIRASTRSES